MRSRFAGARRIRLSPPAGPFEVFLAEGFRLRLLGLTGLEEDQIEPLLFRRCRSIHTLGMRTPIDLVWLMGEPGEAAVIGVVEGLPPRRLARAPGRARGDVSVLELAPGGAHRAGFRPGSADQGRDPTSGTQSAQIV